MDIDQYDELSGSEIEFLSQKEDEGNLVSEISSEFTNNADQITITPATGKKFKLVGIKLYPVVDSIITGFSTVVSTANRRADVELTFDSVVRDILTHDMEVTFGSSASGADVFAQGNGGQTGQYTGLAKGISMLGDGVKTIKLTSTNISGTYRVGILGYYEDV